MGLADWVSKKLLSDDARAGGASAAAMKKQDAEDARLRSQAAAEAAANREKAEAQKAVSEIKFKRGGAVKKPTQSFKW